MNLGIVCRCEGMLSRRLDGSGITDCSRCRKTWPTKDLEVVLKLLQTVDYQPQGTDQTPPTDDEKHNALTIATRKLIALGVKVMDLDELAPAPAPMPSYRPPSTTTTTVVGNWGTGNIFIRVTFR